MVIMSNSWKTSVNELLSIFRGALLSLIPWLEKARINWKEGETYDDWDNIAEALYENIVCSSLTGEVTLEYKIAKYNFNYDDYNSIDFIGVKDKDNSEKKYAFVAFQNDSSPMNSIKVAVLNKIDKVVGYTILKYDDLEFVFIKNDNGQKKVIDKIDVAL